MKLPQLAYIAPMNLDGPRQFTLDKSCPNANPHDELLVLHLQDRAKSLSGYHLRQDNVEFSTPWGTDRDPGPGRVLRSRQATSPTLQGGVADLALALTFKPGPEPQPVCLSIVSGNGNLESRLEWKDGVLVRDTEKRVLADGRIETLELVVDPKTGVLRYEQDVK